MMWIFKVNAVDVEYKGCHAMPDGCKLCCSKSKILHFIGFRLTLEWKEGEGGGGCNSLLGCSFFFSFIGFFLYIYYLFQFVNAVSDFLLLWVCC
jgi:hypothetical protein